jgi:hypothetical protein
VQGNQQKTPLQVFNSPQDLWKTVESEKEKVWYAPAVIYWDKQPASYDGVLGGVIQTAEAMRCPARSPLQVILFCGVCLARCNDGFSRAWILRMYSSSIILNGQSHAECDVVDACRNFYWGVSSAS